MDLSTALALVENLGILSLGAVLVLSLSGKHGLVANAALRPLALGAVFGVVSLAVVQMPIHSPFGATFDTRAAPLVLAGYYAGPLGGFVAAAIGAVARYNVGGPAALGGAASCFLYLAAGLAARRFWGREHRPLGLVRLLVLAAGATALVVPSFFIGQPFDRGLAILEKFWPVLAMGNIVGLAVLGTILDQLMALVAERNRFQVTELTARLARQAAAVGVWQTDFRADTLEWDAVQRTIMGFAPEPAVVPREALLDFVYPGEAQALAEAFERARRTGNRFQHRFRIVRTDGEVRQILAVADFFGGTPGDPDRAVGVNIDETRERAMGEEIALKSAAIDAASCGILIASAKGDYPIIYANAHFAAMTGYTVEEIVGKNCRFLNQGDRDQPELAKVRTALGEGSACSVTLRNRRKDGSPFWNTLRLAPIRDAQGKLTHFLGIQQDITEQVEAREALTAARDQLRAILRSAPSAILTVDSRARITMMNDAAERLFGWPQSELKGQPIERLIPKEFVAGQGDDALGDFADNSAQPGAMVTAPRIVDARHRDGSRVPVQVSLARFESAGAPAIAVTAHDMTDLVAGNRKLEALAAHLSDQLRATQAASEAKTRFLANMSHELRTPLNAILGFTDMLLLLGLDRFERRRVEAYLNDIHKSGRHLLDLINDVLDLSRIEHGSFPIEIAALDPQTVLDGAVDIVRPLAIAKNLRLDIGAAPARRVMCDARAARQCLLNLLSNAVKFSPPDGSVAVRIRTAGARLEFEVTDDGPGIPQSVIERLGEPFLRAADPIVSTTEGTGLGLAITRKLALGQGGELRLFNRTGQGTCAVLSLPAESATKSATPERAA
jgi:PAS domain S-box-containing protein